MLIDPETRSQSTISIYRNSHVVEPLAWSPANHLIAVGRYEGDFKIISVVDAQEVNNEYIPHQTEPAQFLAFYPRWSNDGKTLFFQGQSVEVIENPDIYALSTESREIRNISVSLAPEYAPAPSPNGKYLAFTSIRDHQNLDVYISDIDGTHARKIYSEDGTDNNNPVWSPDSKKLAVISRTASQNRLTLINMNGSIMPLTMYTPNTIFGPVWSPNGAYIAYSEGVFNQETQLFIVNIHTAEITQLTHMSGVNSNVSWSRDSQNITFQSNINGDFEIYVLSLDTLILQNLTNNEEDDIFPLWLWE